MVARISGEGVPVMAWIFSIWSISFVPGNSGNKLTTCTAGLDCLTQNVAMVQQVIIFCECVWSMPSAVCLCLHAPIRLSVHLSVCIPVDG